MYCKLAAVVVDGSENESELRRGKEKGSYEKSEHVKNASLTLVGGN